jgi:hypothetical protein
MKYVVFIKLKSALHFVISLVIYIKIYHVVTCVIRKDLCIEHR